MHSAHSALRDLQVQLLSLFLSFSLSRHIHGRHMHGRCLARTHRSATRRRRCSPTVASTRLLPPSVPASRSPGAVQSRRPKRRRRHHSPRPPHHPPFALFPVHSIPRSQTRTNAQTHRSPSRSTELATPPWAPVSIYLSFRVDASSDASTTDTLLIVSE